MNMAGNRGELAAVVALSTWCRQQRYFMIATTHKRRNHLGAIVEPARNRSLEAWVPSCWTGNACPRE